MTRPWHANSIAETVGLLETDRVYGLSHAEAQKRLEIHGPNSLPAPKRKPAWLKFLLQFHNPLIYVLIAAAAVTFWLEDYVDSGVIAAVVLLNAIIAHIQEGKAEKALEAVQSLLSQKAVVVRSGERKVIDAKYLVPGDLVALESGDQVPADLRLTRAHNFSTVEGAMTGESIPVTKNTHEVSEHTDLADRLNMVYAGTAVATGQAKGIVVATAVSTELGKIGALVGQVTSLATPLTKKLDVFAKQVTLFVLLLGAATFGYGYFVMEYPATELFIAVVGLAVAAIPEGLPAVVTIALAFGTRIMAKAGAVIRRLPAVEALGSVSVICTDKTGTLTKNEMTVVQVLLENEKISVSGSGYEPLGELSKRSEAIEELLRCAVVCNHAELRETESGWLMVGDPTEGSLLTLGAKAGVTRASLGAELIDEIPFESDHRFMAIVARIDGKTTLYLKGAPEKVLELSNLTGEQITFWHEKISSQAALGQRVLGLAKLDLEEHSPLTVEGVFGLQLLGFVGIIDPPREEAVAAIKTCQQAGISIKMITGDHVLTAAAIGEELGLRSSNPLQGSEIDTLSDKELAVRLAETDIVARANPEHKLRLVSLLQASGLLVAMTGDGVNDAPALKAADIGVAMGLKGTDAARGASDMVLSDDNFATIAGAVERGRVVYDNIKKSLLFLLPTNIGEAGVIVLAVLFGAALPITAGQILWINMVTAVTLAFALVFETREQGVMQRGPNPQSVGLVGKQALYRLVFVAALLAMAVFVIFEWEIRSGADLETARTAAVAVLVAAEIAYLFNVRQFVASAFSGRFNFVALYVTVILIFLQLFFTYAPVMNTLFASRPLGLESWIRVIGLAVLIFLIVELEKLIRRKFSKSSF